MRQKQAEPNVEAATVGNGGTDGTKVGITRRTYLRKSLMAGTALAGSGTLDFFDT